MPEPSTQERSDYNYARPHLTGFITKGVADFRDVGKKSIQKEALKPWIVIAVTTGLLIVADQYLIDKARNLGDHLGISHTQYQKSVASTKVPFTHNRLDLFEGPFDSGSALYFIGDGWVHFGIAGAFLTYGLSKSDNRAMNTASEIAESVLASGAVVQVLKHVTGRESPFTTNVPRGVWRFFPNQIDYAHHVPSYDAFPSGHLDAAVATFVVINENYPEYHFIQPLGITLLSLLSFQMMNNGVHWASDYPLAIGMGYAFGHMAVEKGRTPAREKTGWHFSPVLGDGVGIQASIKFSGLNPKVDD